MKELIKYINYDSNKLIRSWFQSFIDIYKKSSEIGIKEYPNLCNKVFKEDFNKKLSKEYINLINKSKGSFTNLKRLIPIDENPIEFIFREKVKIENFM